MKSPMKSRVSVFVLCISMCVAWASQTQAADHYVRAGASGANDGSNWTNAWTQLPAALVRGDTYYIAAGVYPPYTFDDAESSTTLIRILKAVETAHGAAPDWNSAYSGPALFTGNVSNYMATITFSTGYWVFDGVKGIGQGTSEPYGFKITVQNDANSYLAKISYGADYVTISHTEMQHLTMGETDIAGNVTKGIYATSSDNGGSSHLLISRNYIHEVTSVMMQLSYITNSVVEYNYMEHRLGGDYINSSGDQVSIHGEAMAVYYCGLNANNTIRYNTFKDINGTGYLVIANSGPQAHFYIYGNLFFATDDRFPCGNGAVCNTTVDTNTYMYVFNNTFVDLRGPSTGIYWSHGSNNYTYNNLWYNCGNAALTGTEHDYNWFYASGTQSEPHIQVGTQDPFVNRAAWDFRLAAPTSPGTSDFLSALPPGDSSYYTHDMNGKERVNWDRGAFECSTGVTDTQAPSVPQNVTATAVSSTRIDLTWTASTDNVGVAYYRITRNSAALTTVSLTSYQDQNLTPSTSYTYQVTARDFAGNASAPSASASATTQAPLAPEFSIGDVSVMEGNSGTRLAVFAVTLSAALGSESSVDYATSDGTATAASGDYQSISGKLIFPAASTKETLAVVVNADATMEPNETFAVGLSNAVGAPIVRAQGTGTIQNDDPSAQQDSALKAHWKLDDASGSQAADSSGNNNTGTLTNGPAWTTGRLGGALSFDGVDDYADVGQSGFGLGPEMTIAFWVCPTGTATGYQTLMARDLYVEPFNIQISKTTGQIRTGVRTAAGTNYLNSTSSVNVDEWRHVVLTYKSGERLIYMDGALNASNAPAGDLVSSVRTTRMGYDGGTQFFKGKLDDVRIYNRVLSAAEIQGLFLGTEATGDTEAPSVPASPAAAAVSSTQIDVSWQASTDNTGVAGYRVFRNAAFLRFLTGTSFRDAGLTQGTQYTYAVSAYDEAGNESAQSAGVSATPPAPTDTQPPTVPASLSATSTVAKQIQISWAASTDNVGVTGYNVYRSGTSGGAYSKVNVSPVAGLGYTDTGLTDGSTYYYVVKAVDAEPNESVASPEASATTKDATPPDAPKNVLAEPL